MEIVFSALAVLLFLQSLLALLTVFRFVRYTKTVLGTPREDYTPKTVIILPCKGLDPDFEENIIAYLALDYPSYELVFVTESQRDPAYPVIRRILHESNRSAWLIVAGEAQQRGQKVHNLCVALDTLNAVDRKTEVFVFADADARPAENWLQELLYPLSDRRVGAVTGFRWYLAAKGGLAAHLLSVWNASALNLLGERSAFAWGGATAINRDTFDNLKIKESWESGAVSDDYVLSSLIRQAGLRIKFAPLCLMPSEAGTRWRDLLEFTTRQMVITRVCAPSVWWFSFATTIFFIVAFWGGWIALLTGQLSVQWLPLLIGSWALGALSGGLRAYTAFSLLPAFAQVILRKSFWAYLFLHPFVALLYGYNLIVSALSRKIVWRGIGYELRSATETIIWQRASQQTANTDKTTPQQSGAPAHTSPLDS